MTAADAACEALLEMEGQKLGSRSSLGEKQGPWLTHSLTQSLTKSLTHSFSTENAGTEAVCCQFMFQTLHETIQDGSSLQFVAATAGREWYIQDARGGGLCLSFRTFKTLSIPNSKSLGAENFERMFTPHHVSHVTCHVSPVTCHVSGVPCKVSHVSFLWTMWWSYSVEGLSSTGLLRVVNFEKNICMATHFIK